MKAAWDWHLSRETARQERELVAFAADCGFDTLIVRDPTRTMVEVGRERGVRLVAIVDARPDAAVRESRPDLLQRVHPVECAILDALDDYESDDVADYWRFAHRRYPHVHGADFLCLERDASLERLEERVSEALSVADGVAFDGFGFKNHYACFCDRCDERRERRAAETEGDRDACHPSLIGECSEQTLVRASKRLYEHAKSEDPSALVTNHVWPPFAPNPTYGRRLHLDYCTQTISWFYRPARRLERVEFEAAERARLARRTGHNEFVPFVGLVDDPYHRRSADRVRRELEIGLEYGDGCVVLSTLGLVRRDSTVEAAVRDALRE